ncbi:hypothetical protein [Marisediminicola sp. LYQ134]|uniref:hypothetical protein n=1 Tax=Marisediminicola sp. LYQ134 TaxID=3391061 RepID=UPI0039836A9D
MRTATVAPAVVLALTIVLTGCTAAPATRESSESAAATTAPTPDPGAEQFATIEAFVGAAFQGRYDEAAQHASPGSAAERYVSHQRAMNTGYNANGDGQDDLTTLPTLSFDDGLVTVVEGDSEPYNLSDFTFDDEGLVTGWAGKSGPVAEALWTQPWSGQSGGNTIDLTSAYRANSGNLFVVIKVAANERATAPYSYSATYSASDGITYSAAYASQPDEIAAGSAGYIVVVFEGAPFGGTVNLDGASPDDFSATWTASVPVA